MSLSSVETKQNSRSILKTAHVKRSRPRRPNAISASMTFAWRAMLKIKYVPEQLLDVTALPIMFTLMFTYLFGGAIAGSAGEYLQFLLPGIIVQTVVFITMYTGLQLNIDISKGIFDRFRSLPIWRPSYLVGGLLVDTVRYSIASAVMIGLGLLLGFRPEGGATGVILGVLLLLVFAFCLSWVWTTLGLIMRTEKALNGVSMVLLFPLAFMSNIFVDPETMPSGLQRFVDVNPVTLLVTAVRGLMSGTASVGQIGWALLVSGVILVVFAPLTMYLYRNKS